MKEEENINRRGKVKGRQSRKPRRWRGETKGRRKIRWNEKIIKYEEEEGKGKHERRLNVLPSIHTDNSTTCAGRINFKRQEGEMD